MGRGNGDAAVNELMRALCMNTYHLMRQAQPRVPMTHDFICTIDGRYALSTLQFLQFVEQMG